MKSLMQAVVVAAALVAPVMSYAQSDAPRLTRAQVRAELVQLEKAGYNPSNGEDAHYPAQIEAAEAKVAAQNAAASGYGGTATGSSQSGGHATVSRADWNAMYNHP